MYKIDNLRLLEAEAIHLFREAVAEFENPVMLYSVGKDSLEKKLKDILLGNGA